MQRLSSALKARVDWPIVLRSFTRQCPGPFSIFVIYRRRNSENVHALMREPGCRALFAWGLEGIDPSLSAATVGEGRGTKFALLDRMLEQQQRPDDEWLVFADDDVLVNRGTLRRFLTLAHAVGADVAQPGHDSRGYVNYGLTVSRPLTRVRLTTFVEIGPVFAVAPQARDRIVPFGDVGMGYGLEQCWYNLEPRPRFAVVDEVRMRHLAPTGGAYDTEKLVAAMPQLWRLHGVTLEQPQETLRSWPAWSLVGL